MKSHLLIILYVPFFLLSFIDLEARKIKAPPIQVFTGWGFKVAIPKDILVKKKSSVEDFELYLFTIKGIKEPFMFAYAGNHPSFPKLKIKDGEADVIKIGDLSLLSYQGKNVGNKYFREALLDKTADFMLPENIHFWYTNLTAKEKSIADKIIESLQYTGEKI